MGNKLRRPKDKSSRRRKDNGEQQEKQEAGNFLLELNGYVITVYPTIGEGSFGRVCKATNKTTGESVAAKGIRFIEHQDENEDMKRMAMEEAERMKAIQHSNIVPLYDYGFHDGTAWLFMQFCELGDLEYYLKRKPDLPLLNKCEFIQQISDAISYLHNHNPPVMHRDIKPENILLTKDSNKDKILLADFGFAKFHDFNLSEIGSAMYQTTHDSLKGSPRFMAPEFSMEDEECLKYTAKVDVFSAGLLFAVLIEYGPHNKSLHPLSGRTFKINFSKINFSSISLWVVITE